MRVYFHLRNHTEAITDSDGLDVDDLEEAKVQALEAAEGLCLNDPTTTYSFSGWSLEAADDSGRVLFSLDLDTLDFNG